MQQNGVKPGLASSPTSDNRLKQEEVFYVDFALNLLPFL